MKCPKCQSDNPETKQFCGDCGTSLTSAEEAQPSITKTIEMPREELTTGSTFAGRYQIIEELGKGGMGKVYKVLDKETKERIALKLIKPEIALDKNTIERFRNELTIARQISHRNVCRMFDLNREQDNYYITMEYVSGGDLKKFIRRSKRLEIGTAISIAKQVCDGLGEAHDLGIVHRDLKPNNIMIDDMGNAKIMDFGIARTVKSKGITGSGVMIGTPEYMSPEQVDGKDVDLRTDIYAMGVILYEMLTGQLPFEGDTPFTVGVKQKSETPENPQEINPNLSDDLSRVILKCLEKERDTRYPNTEELCADLESIEKGLPTTARVAPTRKPLTSREITVQFSLRKTILPALGVLAVMAVGLILWHPWSKDEAGPIASSDRPSLAVMYFENNTGAESLDQWRKGISDLLITDLTQSRYLKVLGGDRLFDILSEMDQLEARSHSAEVLKEVAVQGGVNHIVRGSYSKAGDILRINLVLQNAQSGEPIATHSVEGKGEEAIFSLVDELTRWTKESLRLSSEQMASDLDQQIGKVTTSSPEAYKFYAEGCEFFQKEEYEQSIATFEKAVALDPGFAMAYRKISVAFGNLNKWEERRNYIQKALGLSDRLPEREKLLIQATYFGSYTTAIDKAIKAYEKLVSLYPESSEAVAAHHNLGVIYSSIEEWDNAIKNYRLAIGADPNFRMTHAQLALVYLAKGDYQEAEAVMKSTIERFPDYKLGYWYLARLYAFQGRFDLALDEVERAAVIDPTYTKAQFYHVMGEFEKAEEEYEKWFSHLSPSTHRQARQRLSCLYRAKGRFRDAKNQARLGLDLAGNQTDDYYLGEFYYQLALLLLREKDYTGALEVLDKAGTAWKEELPEQFFVLEIEGRIYAEMGDMEQALKTAEELKGMVEASPFRKRIRHYHFLRGMIQRQRQDYAEAIESIKTAVSLLPHPSGFLSDGGLCRYYLALTYFESGDLRAARDSFEEMVAFIPGRIANGDLYAEGYYWLGIIYEREGNSAKAIEDYTEFLDLWKDADPGLPEVADARERVAALRQ